MTTNEVAGAAAILFVSVNSMYQAYRAGRAKGRLEGFEDHKKILASVWGDGDYFEGRRRHDETVKAIIETRASERQSGAQATETKGET
jgi:hypothetical protein